MQWIKKHGNPPEEDLENPEIKALLALVETKLRDAWVCAIFSTRWAGWMGGCRVMRKAGGGGVYICHVLSGDLVRYVLGRCWQEARVTPRSC
jgi:hypothetical protein